MSLPRTVTLHRTAQGYRIAQAPVREVEAVRRDADELKDIRLGGDPVALPIGGGAMELQLEIDFGSADQVTLELADDQGYRSLIGVNRAAGELFFDRTRSGPHFHDAFADRHTAPIEVHDGRVKLRVFVDQSIVEIFADDGRTTLTDRFFRGGKTLQWSATARNGTARIRSLDLWQMADARPRREGTN